MALFDSNQALSLILRGGGAIPQHRRAIPAKEHHVSLWHATLHQLHQRLSSHPGLHFHRQRSIRDHQGRPSAQ